MSKPKPQRKRLKASEFEVYAQAQRKLLPNWAKSIADSFDVMALGAFIISARSGHYYVVDGQHRLEALRILGRDDSLVDCLVYQDLTKSEEAALFIKYNNTKIVRAVDKFHVRVTSKEEVACDIKSICDSLGITIQGGAHRVNTTSAVGALDKIYSGQIVKSDPPRDGRVLLSETLAILQDAWGGDEQALTAGMLTGLAAFLARYDDQIDQKRLVRLMKSYSGGAAGMIRNAKALRDIRRISPIGSYAGLLVDMYNSKRKTKLPDWGR